VPCPGAITGGDCSTWNMKKDTGKSPRKTDLTKKGGLLFNRHVHSPLPPVHFRARWQKRFLLGNGFEFHDFHG
jgi:hypothetical protein